MTPRRAGRTLAPSDSIGRTGGDMRNRSGAGHWLLAGCLAICVVAAPLSATARDEDPDRAGPLLSMSSMLCTLVYSPLKIAYAVSGIAVGSLAWLWSGGSKRVAMPIFRSALGGDYVVLPAHLRGREKLRFRGHR